MLNAQCATTQSRQRLITKVSKPTKITKRNSVVLGGLGALATIAISRRPSLDHQARTRRQEHA
jgi:hypothetical protein